MSQFQSLISPNSSRFVEQREDMLALIARLRTLEERTREASRARNATFEKRGQLPPRERLAHLLDPGLPFLRLHTLANYLWEDESPETSLPGGSLIAGIGFISGVRCMVVADDSGIRAGAMTMGGLEAMLSALDIAQRQRLPFVHLVESAGANLLGYKVELWARGGTVFRRLAELSAAGIPTLAVLHGPSTAGGAYMPGMSDYVIGVRKNGMAALAGAALVRAATGETANERELGGSEMHASTSGLVEYLADDDAHAMVLCREVMGKLDWNRHASPARRTYGDASPRYSPDELAGVVPVDYKIPYDVREVLVRIVDRSELVEHKPLYGATTVCAKANITGIPVGIVGNNGPIDPDGATKVAQFVQLCDQAQTPLIYLNNTTGYMVGTRYEQAGMIKHGAKMIQAVSNVRVPRIALYIGASYGAGNYGMSGFGYRPDFLFAWPNASTGVMGGEQAALAMSEVARAIAARKGQEAPEAALEAQRKQIVAHFQKQENAFYTSGRVLDHGVIDPRDTRQVLAMALETCLEARSRTLQPNAFGVGRM